MRESLPPSRIMVVLPLAWNVPTGADWRCAPRGRWCRCLGPGTLVL